MTLPGVPSNDDVITYTVSEHKLNRWCSRSNDHHVFHSKRKLTTNSKNEANESNESIWVQHLPDWAKPYAYLARVDKPIGTALLLWPCLWSTALAASQNIEEGAYLSAFPDLKLVGLFTIGMFSF